MSGVGPGGGNGGSSSSDDNKSGGPRNKLRETSNDPDFPSTDEDITEDVSESDMSISPEGGKASGSELSPPSTKTVPSGKAETSTGASSSFPSTDHVNTAESKIGANTDESDQSTARSRPIQGTPSGASQGESEPFENLATEKSREQTWQELRDRIVDRLDKEKEEEKEKKKEEDGHKKNEDDGN